MNELGVSAAQSYRSISVESGVVLVIPSYKPGESLPKTARDVLHGDADHVIGAVVVVDDGSGEEYEAVFRKVATIPNVTVIRHAVNLGKGAALRSAFNHVLLTWPECAGIVTADSDGQHAPSDIIRVAKALIADPTAMVLGVRSFDHDVPMRSWFGNWITQLVFRVVAGYALSDTQTGLRGWSKDVCREALHVALNGYDFELETLVNSDIGNRSGTAIHEIPIETIYIGENASSHFNPIADSMRIYFVFVRYCGSSIATAIADYIVFILVLTRYNDVTVAQVSARMVAIFVAFTLVRNVVYRSDVGVLSSFCKFVALAIVTGAISLAMIDFLSQSGGIAIPASKLIAEGLLFVGNFAITRAFLFPASSIQKPSKG